MATLLDTIGSTVIGGMILFLVLGLNLQINSSSYEKFSDNYTQMNMTTTCQIIEHDFYKIGYMIADSIITTADSNRIAFNGGLIDDSTSHSYLYYLGTVNQMTHTINPNDMPLYRQKDSNSVTMIGIVRDFKLAYLDSAGSKINYGSLNSKTWRDKIRSIYVYLKIESPEKANGAYQAIEWKKTIRPKNLR